VRLGLVGGWRGSPVASDRKEEEEVEEEKEKREKCN